MDDDAIVTRDLGHAYRRDRWVFRHCNFKLPKGEVMAVLGRNGCGKSTLLRLLLGLVRPAEGSARLAGAAAFVPQLFQVSFDYSVLDMVLMGRAKRMGLFAQPSRHDEAAALSALERFGLDHEAERPFQELSGGQQQLAILARALVCEAPILVMDEPASMLDLRNQGIIMDWIARLAHEDGLTIIFSTHDPGHALNYADKAMLMLDAQNSAFGVPGIVMSEDNLYRLYDVRLRRVLLNEDGQQREVILAPASGTVRR
jgi:iron complex transport system ATP-binding protein